MVYGVVVDERREMNELDSRCKRHGLRPCLPRDAGAMQHERGTEHLSAHRHQMRPHLSHKRSVVPDRGGHLLRHCLEQVLQWRLDSLERVPFVGKLGYEWGGHPGGAHPASAESLSAVSRNPICTASTRWKYADASVFRPSDSAARPRR